jgi:hypothetical protein
MGQAEQEGGECCSTLMRVLSDQTKHERGVPAVKTHSWQMRTARRVNRAR